MIRRSIWVAGAPARALLVGAIRLYRVTLSGWLGGQCRFHPSCSQYALDAIRARGAIRGIALAVWRVLRCNPFGRGGIDDPPSTRSTTSYDRVISARPLERRP